MQKIRYSFIVMWMLLCPATFAAAQVSIGIGLPNVNIGVNLPLFPQLVPVPGYPVYYAPQVAGNYFFYDGMYWVYQNDNWYASSWYNGPWGFVEPEVVPLFVLRIPVYYYRQPPVYFSEWQSNAPPRWGQHWGHGWEQRRSGWDHWNHGSAPGRAPLPVYQRQYSGDRYPRVEQQHALRSQSYRYQPREKVVRQHLKQQAVQNAPAPVQRDGKITQKTAPDHRPSQQPVVQQPKQKPVAQQPKLQPAAPQRKQPPVVSQPKQKPAALLPKQQPAAPQHKQQPVVPQPKQKPAAPQLKEKPGDAQRGQHAPRLPDQGQRSQDRNESQEPNRGHGQGQNNR